MKVVFLLEAGIPNYRNFLFSYLDKHEAISDFLVIHTGRIYDGKVGDYKDKKVRFIGSNKLGAHIGILKYFIEADVIVSSYNLRIVSCWMPSFIFGKKWIFWGKGLGENDGSLIKFLRRQTAQKAKYLLLYNDDKKAEFVKKTGVSESKIVAYQNTIRIDNAEDLGLDEKKYFLYFGRIQSRKGLMELLYEFKKYLEQSSIPKYRLRLVGNGDYKEFLISESLRLGINKDVEFFPGVFNDDEIIEHFRNAVCYVSPFNVGLAVINSFAYGVPVVTCIKPQVGPEFFYLNKTNSIIVEDISNINTVFRNLDTQNTINHVEIFEFYKKNLHYSIMLERFVETIKKVK